MKDLRVHLTSGIYPPDKGGPAFFVSEYSQWLQKYVSRTKVISLKDGPSVNQGEQSYPVFLTSRDHIMPLRMLESALNIIRPLFAKKIVLVNGLFIEALFASFFMRSRIIAKIPGDIVWERARNQGKTQLSIDEYQGKEQGFESVFRFFFSYSLKRADIVITPSLHLKTLLERWGVDTKRIVLIRNSVDTNLFLPISTPFKKYDVITVCRLVPWKGVEELIKVCAEKELFLAVVGDGPNRNQLEDVAAATGAKVEFLGDCSHDQLPKLLNSSRLFVLNSQYEGSPHSLIEALSVGLVSIARESTGSSEVIRDGVNGLLCGKSRTLADAIVIALNNSELSNKMSSQARLTALTDFDREKNFNKILEVIEGVQ
jgi:glycosyltransferase involved in cell wall biosynthesis